MKWSGLSAKDRRAVILGAIVLLPGLLYVFGVKPYRAALEDARDQLAAERSTLSRERAALASARRNPQLQHVADSAMRAMGPRLFEGRDDVMASAELASYLSDVARQTRLYLQDAATRPASEAVTGLRSLRVELRGESDIRGVLRFLLALERGNKLLRVDRLDVSRAARSDQEDMETLAITATVGGFALGETGANSPSGTSVATRPNGGQR
jgi:hypothetical protein